MVRHLGVAMGMALCALGIWSCMQPPPGQMATVVSLGETDANGVLTVTVRLDDLENIGKTATVKIAKSSADEAAVGRRMKVFGKKDVHFWVWK
jgi:hypothetical protein